MKKFCPKCGVEITDENSINNFCINCYLEDNEIIKTPVFEITICPKCGVLKYAKRYYRDITNLEKELVKHVKVDLLKQTIIHLKLHLDLEKNEYYAIVTIKTLLGNKLKSIEKKCEISLRKDTCQSCSRAAGGYYTTVVQLRFDDKTNLEENISKKILEVNKIIEETNSMKNNIGDPIIITKKKSAKTGIDLYINNLKLAQKMVSELDKNKKAHDIKHTKTLVGMEKNGQRRYRYTICIHFK
jgi:nonsense-mediated mRNA decay protein 3